MSERKNQEWEELGREAVAEGFQVDLRHEQIALWDVKEFEDHITSRVREVLPDFRDTLTALACIPWLEAVAKKCWGPNVGIEIVRFADGRAWVELVDFEEPIPVKYYQTDGTAPTLVRACIDAVRAAQKEAIDG